MADHEHPTTAAAAAATLHDMKQAGRELIERRDVLGAMAARSEALYRRAEALGGPQVAHGRSADVRKQMLLALEIGPEMSATAADIAKQAGVDIPGEDWSTVGSLRELRDQCKDQRDAFNVRLKLHEAEVRYAQSVCSWAKEEYAQTLGGRVAS